MADQLEVRMGQEVEDIVFASRKEIVEADDVVALPEQPLAEVRAEKTGAAGDQNFLHVDLPLGIIPPPRPNPLPAFHGDPFHCRDDIGRPNFRQAVEQDQPRRLRSRIPFEGRADGQIL